MGYYTSYTLEVEDKHANLIEELCVTNEDAGYALYTDGSTQDSCKWYDHKDDMLRFSQKHPDVMFTLKGEGEEAGDVWVEYYLGGKCQRCKASITFEDFDPDKLT